jgi:pyruvate formate lyase activating enzyme
VFIPENKDKTGIIFDIRRYSIHDGPGIRTTVFFKGCPLRCAWCHNPEGLEPKPEITYREDRCIRCGRCLTACEDGAISWQDNVQLTDRTICIRCGTCTELCYADAREMVGTIMTVDQVMAEIEKDIAFYEESDGGVTLSGGEPLLQPDFAHPILEICKQKGIHTALDTCGFVAWEKLKIVCEHTDLILYDLKLLDEAKHRKYTGVSNDIILTNLENLSRLDHNVLIRLPIIPGMNDDDENIQKIGSFAASLHQKHTIELLPYHELGIHKYHRFLKTNTVSGVRPPSRERIEEVKNILMDFGLTVI